MAERHLQAHLFCQSQPHGLGHSVHSVVEDLARFDIKGIGRHQQAQIDAATRYMASEGITYLSTATGISRLAAQAVLN